MKLKDLETKNIKEISFSYKDLLSNNPDSKEYLSMQAWGNGEGFVVFRSDNTTISFDWAEWAAIKAGVKLLDSI